MNVLPRSPRYTADQTIIYIFTYPNHRLIGTFWDERDAAAFPEPHQKRISRWALAARRTLGGATVREFWDISLLHPEHLWTIDSCTIAAFEKTCEYARNTAWYRGI